MHGYHQRGKLWRTRLQRRHCNLRYYVSEVHSSSTPGGFIGDASGRMRIGRGDLRDDVRTSNTGCRRVCVRTVMSPGNVLSCPPCC